MTDHPFTLYDFLVESNRIEGITDLPDNLDIQVAESFLERTIIDVDGMDSLARSIQPGAVLRDRKGLNVRVGNHVPIPGGPEVTGRLGAILEGAVLGEGSTVSAYDTHHNYETLHPFTDGNGRSGRLLWLWMMGGIEKAPLGFLHHWYYQSLEFSR